MQRGVAPQGPRVELSITDDGPGIPPELLPELFERFTRGDTGRARDATAAGRSTGLGLAIVDAVVAAHGGSIIVTSRPGLTRFAILLPLLREPAGAARGLPGLTLLVLTAPEPLCGRMRPRSAYGIKGER